MKRAALILILSLYALTSSSQKLSLTITGSSALQTKTIDSVGYNHQHTNTKSLIDEVNTLSTALSKIGYIDNQTTQNTRPTDSTFIFQLSLGKRIKYIHIYIGTSPILKSLAIPDTKNDTLTLPFPEVEAFLNQSLKKLEKKGYALAKLKLTNIKKSNSQLTADLDLIPEKQRQLNGIVIKGYDKFPPGHLRNMIRMYKNKTFNQENLNKIHADFDKFRFVKQIKYPEILFEQDSTKIYVYLEKAKSDSFDGFIGFSNDKGGKVAFNGYLDLILNNTLNIGEQFSLLWKSDANLQKTFNIAIELPYIFKSPIGLKAQLNIFKQDSTFQNTKTAIDLGYFFNYNTRLYLGYQATESSDIQNTNTASISDYKNDYVTTSFEYFAYHPDDFLFPEKTRVNIKLGYGTRSAKFNTDKQIFTTIDLKHNFYLNDKNSINLKTQNFYLQSDHYITNELYRFGGINSIRGFSENSLQGNILTSILTEYRYALTPSIYTHSIIDYGYYQDKSTNNKGTLLGLGIGFGLLTKNGLLNIVYANGSTKDTAIKLSNSIVHLSFKTNF